jgi:hypothetical protein
LSIGQNPEEYASLRPIRLVLLEFHALAFCGNCPTVQNSPGVLNSRSTGLEFLRGLATHSANSSRFAVGAQNSPPGFCASTAQWKAEVLGRRAPGAGTERRLFIGALHFLDVKEPFGKLTAGELAEG